METDPCSGSSESGEVNETAVSNATVSLDSSGPIRVESEGAKGGTVAALVGMLFDTSKWSPVVRCVDILEVIVICFGSSRLAEVDVSIHSSKILIMESTGKQLECPQHI